MFKDFDFSKFNNDGIERVSVKTVSGVEIDIVKDKKFVQSSFYIIMKDIDRLKLFVDKNKEMNNQTMLLKLIELGIINKRKK